METKTQVYVFLEGATSKCSSFKDVNALATQKVAIISILCL